MKQLSTQAQAAKLIRQELKKAFPTVKFSVTSDSFSGGDAVRIDWNDGVRTEQVQAISRKYQYGHFDGMYDIYENSNSRDDIPQTKFVTEQRHITDKFYNQMANYINSTFAKVSEPIDLMVYRYLRKMDLSNGLTDEMIHDAIFGK